MSPTLCRTSQLWFINSLNKYSFYIYKSNKKNCRQLLITQIISKQLVLSLTINLINVKIDLYLQWIFFFFLYIYIVLNYVGL